MFDMNEVFLQLEFFGRLILAGFCGAAVGYERKKSMKGAGIRTHFIVAMAAALIMLVSKYGFMDVATLPGHSVDTSRVAASIVSGVGFLGAGLIFVRKYTINGLTTAAGVWATSAIGMAIGGGMYVLGILSTVTILMAQVFLHRRWHFLHVPNTEQIFVIVSNAAEAIPQIHALFEKNNIEILNIKMEVLADGNTSLDFVIKEPQAFKPAALMEVLKECPHILSFEL